MPPPSRETVIGSMAGMVEAETIVRYPEQIDALVAAGGDRVAAEASMREFRAMFAPTGWRPDLQVRREDLGRVSVPTLLVWGERDPLGGADVAGEVADSMIDARLRLVPAGHAPWLGDPDDIATTVGEFLR
jgi:pimeloyl-ACP methyl ester carboxylesterase